MDKRVNAALNTLISNAPQLFFPSIKGLVISTAFSALLADFEFRSLSPKQKTRVQGLLDIAAKKVQQNFSNGCEPTKLTETEIEEIVERTLDIAQHEIENRKILYLGNLIGNISFQDIKSSHANILIRMAGQLSYTQLVLLQIFSDSSLKPLLSDTNYIDTPINYELIDLLTEAKYLLDNEMLTTEIAIMGIGFMNPAKTKTALLGKYLASGMELDQLPQTDIEDKLRILNSI